MGKKISVIVPVYNEEGCIAELHTKIVNSLVSYDVEIIFVDDGSSDSSLDMLRKLSASDKRVKVISFRKNFGQTAAIAAGFDNANGDILVTIDSDLQNDPADIPALIKLIDEGFDVVSGWRKDRKDFLLSRRLPSVVANYLISAVTGLKLHDYGCTLKAYRRQIIKDVRIYGEMHRFLPALASWVGGKVTEIKVRHHPRVKGVSKYNLGRTMKVLIDLITVKFLMSYSTRPNYVFASMGITSIFFGFVSLSVVGYRVFVLQRLQATPLVFIMTILFLVGVQLILMGLLAEIMIRTHFESQSKQIYFTKERLNF
jgi:glycosyltransferase involved in cell wall biosynthesis